MALGGAGCCRPDAEDAAAGGGWSLGTGWRPRRRNRLLEEAVTELKQGQELGGSRLLSGAPKLGAR